MSYDLYILTHLDRENIETIIHEIGFHGDFCPYSMDHLGIGISKAGILRVLWEPAVNLIHYADLSGNVPSPEYKQVYRQLKTRIGEARYVDIVSKRLRFEPEELKLYPEH